MTQIPCKANDVHHSDNRFVSINFLLKLCGACFVYTAMLAVSKAADQAAQDKILSWILDPICAKWMAPAWLAHLGSSATFVAEYMPVQVSGGDVVVGNREQRWQLFHDVYLVQKIYSTGDIAFSRPGTKNPLTPFLQLFVVVGRLLSCIFGLWESGLGRSLGPLKGVLDLTSDEQRAYVKSNSLRCQESGEDAGLGIAGNSIGVTQLLAAVDIGTW